MFTGIVEEIGRVISRTTGSGYDLLVIAGGKVLTDLETGHSINVNGVCLTVTDCSEESLSVHVIPETLEKSNLGELVPGSLVNLERAIGPRDRFNGHIVQGHVETVGYINNISVDRGEVHITITVDARWLRYCIPKGSIALDGVSLTIAEISTEGLTVAIIPHTLSQTTLGNKQVGESLNVETDIIARYLERFLEMEPDDEYIKVDIGKLHSWGFGES